MPYFEIRKKRSAIVHRLELNGEAVSVGRAPENTLVLPGGSVSRKHCVIEIIEHGTLVRDLSSRHGVHVNGERCSRVVLEDGDRLRIGPYHFTYCEDDADTEGMLHGAGAMSHQFMHAAMPGGHLNLHEQRAVRVNGGSKRTGNRGGGAAVIGRNDDRDEEGAGNDSTAGDTSIALAKGGPASAPPPMPMPKPKPVPNGPGEPRFRRGSSNGSVAGTGSNARRRAGSDQRLTSALRELQELKDRLTDNERIVERFENELRRAEAQIHELAVGPAAPAHIERFDGALHAESRPSEPAQWPLPPHHAAPVAPQAGPAAVFIFGTSPGPAVAPRPSPAPLYGLPGHVPVCAAAPRLPVAEIFASPRAEEDDAAAGPREGLLMTMVGVGFVLVAAAAAVLVMAH